MRHEEHKASLSLVSLRELGVSVVIKKKQHHDNTKFFLVGYEWLSPCNLCRAKYETTFFRSLDCLRSGRYYPLQCGGVELTHSLFFGSDWIGNYEHRH